MDIAIEGINLTKEFVQRRGLFPFNKKTTVVLNNINFQVKKGELFALIGPNGAGKTTLIKILSCLIYPTRGTAKIMGADILKEDNKVKSLIGLVTGNERSLYWRLTGRQNLYFFASLTIFLRLYLSLG
jgi:ABC-2 type transport system ATP-binding protein